MHWMSFASLVALAGPVSADVSINGSGRFLTIREGEPGIVVDRVFCLLEADDTYHSPLSPREFLGGTDLKFSSQSNVGTDLRSEVDRASLRSWVFDIEH